MKVSCSLHWVPNQASSQAMLVKLLVRDAALGSDLTGGVATDTHQHNQTGGAHAVYC